MTSLRDDRDGIGDEGWFDDGSWMMLDGMFLFGRVRREVEGDLALDGIDRSFCLIGLCYRVIGSSNETCWFDLDG
jgi:hypothetical protein